MSWQASVEFSVRFKNATKLYRLERGPGAPEPTRTITEARDLEKTLFYTSLSFDQYQNACDEAAGVPCQEENDDETSERSEENAEGDATCIGRYVDAKQYRDGLFSCVYKARAPKPLIGEVSDDVDLVALKITTPSLMEEPHNSKRETRILARLKHDNVIPLLDDFQQSGGHLVLVFPFMSYDLQLLLEKHRVDHEQAKSHLRNMFSALQYLHSMGIIHRDVKPSNVLLKTPSGPAYLADFGIAWSPTDKSSENADSKITDVGTTCYRPPELLFGNKRYGCSLDIWAAGCVAAELVTLSGRSLFDSGDLGSEFALIRSIFSSLGTPTLDTWPEAITFPDWGKMNFRDYPPTPWSELLPKANSEGQDLVSKLVCFESSSRPTAAEALRHPFLL